jgi:hypothetical protein
MDRLPLAGDGAPRNTTRRIRKIQASCRALQEPQIINAPLLHKGGYMIQQLSIEYLHFRRFIMRSLFVAIAVIAFFYFGHFIHCNFYNCDTNLTDPAISSILGLISTLFSIVAGLLISASYSQFNAQRADIQQIVSSLLHVDFILQHHLQDSREATECLHRQALRIRERFWPSNATLASKDMSYEDIISDLDLITKIFDSLISEEERLSNDVFVIKGLLGDIMKTQFSMIRGIRNRIPKLLLWIVFSWACSIFFIFGLAYAVSTVSIYILLVGTAAVAGAFYLILELTNPFIGLFSISSNVLDILINRLENQLDKANS